MLQYIRSFHRIQLMPKDPVISTRYRRNLDEEYARVAVINEGRPDNNKLEIRWKRGMYQYESLEGLSIDAKGHVKVRINWGAPWGTGESPLNSIEKTDPNIPRLIETVRATTPTFFTPAVKNAIRRHWAYDVDQ